MDRVLDDRLLDEFLPESRDGGVAREHFVTAVVVAHNGSHWLPATIEGLFSQARPADLVLPAATHEDTTSQELLTQAFGGIDVVDSAEGLAGALATVAARAPLHFGADPESDEHVSWIWVLHDDSAPEPECLAELLAAADLAPQAGILVPKSVGWADPGLLVDVGRRWAPGMPEVRGLDPWERDQGQHDAARPVYTGSGAGLLVRADLWHWLGGPDPLAGPAWSAQMCRRTWGCGWEVWLAPDAVVAHRMAGQRAVRPGSTPRLARRAEREAQLWLELTQAPASALPWRVVRAGLSTTGRFGALALTRELDEALGEPEGTFAVVRHPRRLRAARTATRGEPVTSLARPPALRAPRGSGIRQWFDDLLAGSAPESAARLATPGWALWAPLLAFLALAILALIRDTSLIFGPGLLQGGGLLGAPRAGALFSSYGQGWHEVGVGSGLPMPTYALVLAAASLLTLGSVDALLRLLLGLYLPLAFLSCYGALGGWRRSGTRAALPRPTRALMSLGYAMLPAGLAAAASGRLSTVALGLLGPWAVRAVAWGLRREPGSPLRTRPAIWAGIALGTLACFVPLAWPVVAVWVLADVVRGARGDRGSRLAQGAILLGVAATALVLQLPTFLRAPSSLLFEVGVNSRPLLGQQLPAWFALGLSPGGPGAPVAAAGIVLSVAAVAAALVRPTAQVLGALALWALGVICATYLAGTQLEQLSTGQGLPAWPGVFLELAGAAALLTCALALLTRPQAHRTTALLPVLALGSLVGLGGVVMVVAGWLAPTGASRVTAAQPLPAVAAADGVGPDRTRSLILRRQADGSVAYYLANGDRAQLGDADVALADPSQVRLDSAVSALVSGAGGQLGPMFRERAVAYFVFDGPESDPAVAALDATSGLRRLAGATGSSLWLVIDTQPRAQLGPAGTAGALAVPVTTSPTQVDVVLHPQIALPRELAVSERFDDAWRGSAAGAALQLTAGADQMIHATVAAPGELVVERTSPRRWLVAGQLALMAIALLLALPKRRMADPDVGSNQPGQPDGPGGGDRPRSVPGG